MWLEAVSGPARFVAAGVIVAGWAVSAGVAGADPDPAPPPSPAPSPAASPAPAPAGKTTIDKDGTYAVDHSASAVIIDPEGREVGLFRPPFDPGAIASDLASLVSGGGQ